MGRGKLTMELIKKEKCRELTFKKRKNGLLKKAEEFSILCAVDTCVIIYGPNINGRPLKLFTWPPEREEVERVIKRYRTDTVLKPSRVCSDLLDFFIDRKKKANDQTSRLQKQIFEAKYPTWDDRIEMLAEDQLRTLLDVLDAKVEAAGIRINKIKGNQQMLEEAMIGKPPRMVAAGLGPQPELIGNQFSSMQALCQDQFFDYPLEPFDTQWFSQSQTDQVPQMLPFDPTLMDNSFMQLLYGEDLTKFSSVSTSNTHAPSMNPADYNMLSGFPSNTILSHSNAPLNYYGLTRQFTPQLMQCPTVSDISAHMHGFQANDLYDIYERDVKNRHLM